MPIILKNIMIADKIIKKVVALSTVFVFMTMSSPPSSKSALTRSPRAWCPNLIRSEKVNMKKASTKKSKLTRNRMVRMTSPDRPRGILPVTTWGILYFFKNSDVFIKCVKFVCVFVNGAR